MKEITGSLTGSIANYLLQTLTMRRLPWVLCTTWCWKERNRKPACNCSRHLLAIPPALSCSSTVTICPIPLKENIEKYIASRIPSRSFLILQETALFTPAREWSTSSPGDSPAERGWKKLLSGAPVPSLKHCSLALLKASSASINMPACVPPLAQFAL